MDGLNKKNLIKKVIIFGLEDILVPGVIEKTVDEAEVKKILENLKKLEDKFDFFHVVLLTGLPEKFALQKIKETSLNAFFKSENIYFVNELYINSKSVEDKEIYLKNISQNERFKDEFFKQGKILELMKKFNCPLNEMILIGHDLMFEGFFSMRYSRIDVAFVKSALSFSNKKLNHKIKDLIYVNLTWNDLRKLLLGKFSKPDLKELEKYVFNALKEKLFEWQTILQGPK